MKPVTEVHYLLSFRGLHFTYSNDLKEVGYVSPLTNGESPHTHFCRYNLIVISNYCTLAVNKLKGTENQHKSLICFIIYIFHHPMYCTSCCFLSGEGIQNIGIHFKLEILPIIRKNKQYKNLSIT